MRFSDNQPKRCFRLRKWLPWALGLQALLLVACEGDVPAGVIPQDKMEDILYDYHLAQMMAEEQHDSIDWKRYLYITKVFEKYDVTEADFDSSMIWYAANSEVLAKVYERVNARYDAELKAYGQSGSMSSRFDNLKETGDTANIWREKKFYMLRAGTRENCMTFTIQADTSFYLGDALLWQFRPYFLYEGGVKEAYAALTIRYENDSISSVYQAMGGNGEMELYLNGSEKSKIREIEGFVYQSTLPEKDDAEKNLFRMLTLSDMRLIRFHKQDTVPDQKNGQQVADSLKQDSAATDTLHRDTARQVPATGSGAMRRTPQELRDGRHVEKTIHVVKDRPYRAPGRYYRRQR